MPLPGGPSDKIGNRYERRWTTYCMIKVMFGEYDSIYLEPFEEEKAEFLLRREERKQYHQAKRQLAEGNWTLAKLSTEGILEKLARSLDDPDIYWVFVSGHPAPELRELSERAKTAANWPIFSRECLGSQKATNDFNDLKRRWQNPSDEETFVALQHIEIITIDESMLRELNIALVQQFYDRPVAENVISVLKEYAEDNVHTELSAQDIREHLKTRGYEIEVFPKGVVSPVVTSHPSISVIEHSLRRDIEMLSGRLSQEIDAKLKSIDQARKEGKTDGLIEQLEGLKTDSYRWLSLIPEQKAEALCIEAVLTVDVKDDIGAALQLTQQAETFAQTARVIRTKAWIIAYKKGDWQEALSLLEGQSDIDSINLRSALLADSGKVREARLLLENELEPNAETFRSLATIHIREKNLDTARKNIQQAIAREPNWPNIKFAAGVIDCLSSLSEAALNDISSPWLWPPLVPRALVTLDHGSLQLTRSARRIFEELVSSAPQSTIAPPHLWYLACLVYDPESEKEASEYCAHLLGIDASHIPTIMWAMLLNLNVAIEPIKANLQDIVQNEIATPEHKLALADVYHKTGDNEHLFRFLEAIKAEFEQNGLISNWNYHYIRVLLTNDDYDKAEKVVQEIELENDDAKFTLETLLYQYRANQTADFDPLITHLKKRFDDTQTDIDLLSYCQILRQTLAWDTLLDHVDELRKRIDTSDINWLTIQTSFETDHYQRCLELLDSYLNRFVPIVPRNHLLDIRAACLEELGLVNEAIRILEELTGKEPTDHHFHNLAHLYFTIGDKAKLEILAQQLLAQNFRHPNVLIDLADLLQNHNPEIAIRLWHQASKQGISDDTVGRAWVLAEQLGLHVEAEDIFGRLVSLGEQGKGGLQPATPSDVFKLNRESHQKAIDARTEYLKGTIPLHIYTDELNIPLITQYYFNFRTSIDNAHLHRQTAILARHGGRPIVHPRSPEEVAKLELYADLTAILIAANLEPNLRILDVIEEAFSPVFIPQQLIPALEEMERALTRKQPEILAAKKQVLELIDVRSITVLDTTHVTLPEETGVLQEEIRESQIALLHLAKEENGYYADFLPIHKLTRAAEIRLAEIPTPWSEYIINRQSIAESLRILGKITNRKYQAAVSKLRDNEIPTLESRILDQNTNIYFDSNAIEFLAQADILSAASKNFHLFVTQSYESYLRNELAWNEHSAEMILWLQQLIRHLNQGVQTGKYQFIHNPKKSRLFEFGHNTQCILALLETPRRPDAVIWIDDRFSNSAPFGDIPTIGINEVLRALLDSNKIGPDEYYDYLIKLRAANLRYIPLEIDELVYHLRQAIVENTFIETLELKTIRRYVASCMEYPNDLQYPTDLPDKILNKQGEIAFVGGLKLNIYKVFSRIWTEVEDPIHRRILADWVVDNLFLDYMALIESYHGQLVDFREHRLVPDLAALTFQFWGMNTDQGIGDRELPDLLSDFSDWMWSNILEPQVQTNPGLLGQVIDRVKLFFDTAKETVQHAFEEEHLQRLALYQVYLNLPEDIRQELNQDEVFLRSIGIEVKSVIEVEGIQFDAKEFWRSASGALDGESASIVSLNLDVEIQLDFEEQDKRKVVVFSHPSEETLGRIQIHHAGILSNKAEEQADDLANKRYWLDCSDEEFACLEREIIKTSEPFERVKLVDQLLDSSMTVRYSNLLEQLKRMQAGDQVNLNDLRPLNLDGLRRHLRLPKQVDDFAEAYSRATEVLLAEESLASTIQRLACLPIPLPEIVLDRFKLIEKTEQDKILNVFGSNRSPTSAMHLLTLRALSENQDAVGQLITFLLSATNNEFTLAFKQVLNWTRLSFETLPDSHDFSDSIKLACIWAHAHYLFSIWIGLGASPEEIAQFFSQSLFSAANPLNYLRTAYYFDIANPVHFDSVRFTLWGIFNAVKQSGKVSFSSENQAALVKVALISDENNLSFHPTLYQNFDRASNLLSSFFGLEIADIVNDYLPEEMVCPNKEERRDLVQTSLFGLTQDAFDLSGWRKLNHLLGAWPIHDELQDDLRKLLLSVDIAALYREQLELGLAASQCTFLQLPHFQNSELWEKSNRTVSDLATFFAEHEVNLQEIHNKVEFDVLVVECLIAPLFVVSSLAENSHTQLVNLVNQVTDIWPFVIPVIRPIVEGIYRRAQAQDCKEYWPLLMKLRARDIGKNG